MQGLLLFAHGARDPRWAAPFEAVAARARALRPEACVRLAFLEFMAPTLGEAIDDLVRQGCRQVDVVPLFLGVGGHVRHEVPALMAAARGRHPAVPMALHPAAGEHPAVTEALAQVAALPLPARGGDIAGMADAAS